MVSNARSTPVGGRSIYSRRATLYHLSEKEKTMSTPHILPVAVVALGLAVAFFILLAYLLIAGKPTTGAFAVTAGNSKLDSNEGGMLLAIVIVLLVISAATWPPMSEAVTGGPPPPAVGGPTATAVTITTAAMPKVAPAGVAKVPAGATPCGPVAGWTASAGDKTSCPFALNVGRALDDAGGGPANLSVWSPVTKKSYPMACSGPSLPIICSSQSSSAKVYLE